MLLLNKHNLAVSVAVSKERSRYTLDAIHVTPEFTEATDGHRLVRVTLPKQATENYPKVEGFTPNGSPKSFLLPSDTVRQLQRAMPHEKSLTILNHAAITSHGEDGVAIAVTDLTTAQVFKPATFKGNFPNVEAVMPKGEPVFQITLNAKYLAELAKAAAAFSSSGDHSLTLSFYDPHKPVVMDAENKDTAQHWRALLMPVRTAVSGAPAVTVATKSE